MKMYRLLSGSALVACLAFSSVALGQSTVSPEIAAAVAAPDRPAADTARDVNRKPAQLVAFAGLKPGDKVADIMPGGGYFTRIFSHVVGNSGHVYAVVPAELAQVAPKAKDAIQSVAAIPTYANVSVDITPTASMTVAEPLDVAWTSDNYHDVYGFFGADAAAALDASVFKMLKPGGEFIVIDHVAAPGTSATSPKGLHRIDPETVKQQVIAAGFVYEGSSDVLANPQDNHTVTVFDPSIRGKTDQFAMKFRKPAQ